jgi:long-subunit fatty acid transport protein
MNKIYIIAGTYEQFKTLHRQLAELMAESGMSFVMSDFVYLDRIEKLMGCYKPWGYKVGTWSERNDIDDISHFLLTRHSSITEDFIEVMS